MEMKELIQRASEMAPQMTELRHHIHANPELSWQEVETSKLIEKRLIELGLENIRRGFRGTGSGVVAEVRGAKAGPCVALRADIDALPIQEKNDLPYASTVPNVMHACGHDAHTTMLLGAAEILTSLKEEIAGTVRLIFQPAEEAGDNSGAPAMIAEGALDGVEAIAGLHVWSPGAANTFSIRQGALMASADIWEIKIQGKGGHASAPHDAIDPTIAASYIISMLQTIVSREIDARESVVLSIGKVESGIALNVIPDTAVISGNIRTTNPGIRSGMEARMRRVIDGVSSALGCTSSLDFKHIYPVTMNDNGLSDLIASVAGDVLGNDGLIETPIIMGSEDFSFYGYEVPAVFGFLGIGDSEKGTDHQHHSPNFNANDDVLPSGIAILCGFALEYLNRK